MIIEFYDLRIVSSNENIWTSLERNSNSVVPCVSFLSTKFLGNAIIFLHQGLFSDVNDNHRVKYGTNEYLYLVTDTPRSLFMINDKSLVEARKF